MAHSPATERRSRVSYWKISELRLRVGMMAERVGFEPTCRLPDKPLSRRPRYDHFGTSPQAWLGELLADAVTELTYSRTPPGVDARRA
jgi:hypothetical protein